MIQQKTRVRRTGNLLVQDFLKLKNGVIVFGTTKVIKKIIPLKKIIKNKINKTYKKILIFKCNLWSKYHLLKGLRLERKSTKHYQKHVNLKEKYFEYNNKFEVDKNIIIKVR